MRILIAMHKIMDLGGVINHAEGLGIGLKDLGHEVDFKLLVWADRYSPQESDRGNDNSVFGMKYEQRGGWVWNKKDVICYKGGRNLLSWKEEAEAYDLVIWEIPVPSKNKDNIGNVDWIQLYDIQVKQLVVIHDGNFEDGYPWLYLVKEKITCAIGVHPCAYNSLKKIDVPRAMVFNPQAGIEARLNDRPAEDRDAGWLSLQTFKAWKRVPELVAAVPYMRTCDPMLLCGRGIDYHYLTSVEKCKYPGIWDEAIAAGMNYRPHISNGEREELLHDVRVLIDPSWNRKYSATGDHFNRVVVDALIGGACPVARNLGISTNAEGMGEVFRAEENYFMVPWDASPSDFAGRIEEIVNDPQRCSDIVRNGRNLLPYFESSYVAQCFIDASNLEGDNLFKKEIRMGNFNNYLDQSAESALTTHFGAK